MSVLVMFQAAIPVLHVRDSVAATHFYCETLGFRQEFAYRPFEPNPEPCYMGIVRDDVRLHLSSFSGDGVSGGVVFLRVEDVDILHDEFLTKSISIAMPPTDQSWGNREMYVHDPDGNGLRFIQTAQKTPNFQIRQMIESDVDGIICAFSSWGKSREQYERYWQENQEGKRITLVAVSGEDVVAYTNIIWEPEYAPFRETGIPEINDMNVIGPMQNQGIGTAMIRECERIVLARAKDVMGIGFGLTPDYGKAQRLYPKLGYIPDGMGAEPTPWGDVLYLTKRLK